MFSSPLNPSKSFFGSRQPIANKELLDKSSLPDPLLPGKEVESVPSFVHVFGWKLNYSLFTCAPRKHVGACLLSVAVIKGLKGEYDRLETEGHN